MTLKRDGLFELKRRWLPLFVFGAAVFGAGIALALLWLYRQSPFTDAVVDFLTPTSPEAPPRGTLIRAAAALFTLVGGGLLAFAIRKINASEVGEIDTFWWKVAVAALAGQWWLGQPRLVVLAAGPNTPSLLRGLKAFTGQVAVLGQPTDELVAALASSEDEAAVQMVLAALAPPAAPAGRAPSDLRALSDGLRLRGRFLPREPAPVTLDAIARADALVCAPDLDAGEHFGLEVDGRIAGAIRAMRGRRLVIGSVAAAQAQSLAEAVRWCAERFGTATVLVNNNSVLPLPPGRVYQTMPGAVERDLLDWTAPERWDAAKLAVFVREAISRP